MTDNGLLTRQDLKELRIKFRDVQKQHDNWSDYVAQAQLAKLQPLLAAKDAEIAELKNQIEDYKRQSTLTYCVYCGATFPLDNEAGTKVTEHIKTCDKHPLFIANAEIERLKKENAELRAKVGKKLKYKNVGEG